MRALEVTLGSGRPFSSYGEGLFDLRARPASSRSACDVDLELLDAAHRQPRFRAWMDQGLLEEVDGLGRVRPAVLSRTARQAVGYRELLRHLEEGAASRSASTTPSSRAGVSRADSARGSAATRASSGSTTSTWRARDCARC